MHHLGMTRSAHRADPILHTTDTFVRAPAPGMQRATAIVHVAPAAGARFTQYTAEFEAGGSLGPAEMQRFVYVVEGELKAEGTVLAAGDYAYFPPGSAVALSASGAARAAVIEKPYIALEGAVMPKFFTGRESLVAGQPLM